METPGRGGRPGGLTRRWDFMISSARAGYCSSKSVGNCLRGQDYIVSSQVKGGIFLVWGRTGYNVSGVWELVKLPGVGERGGGSKMGLNWGVKNLRFFRVRGFR